MHFALSRHSKRACTCGAYDCFEAYASGPALKWDAEEMLNNPDVTTYDELDAIKAEWKDRFSKLPQEVENLISLIKLRISATLCKIGAIRETSEYIRIYTPYKEFEWKILSKKISINILRKIKFTNKSIYNYLIDSYLLNYNYFYNILINKVSFLNVN